MRIVSLVTLFTAVASVGCNAVTHKPQPFVLAGQTLAVSVKVDPKKGDSVSGDLHYRFNGEPYRAATLQLRAKELWAILPTEPLRPGDSVAYYIDVLQGDEHHALASPTSPYVVPVLSRLDALLSSVRANATHGYAHEPIVIRLNAEPEAVDSAIVNYTVPGVPGEVTAAMTQVSPGQFRLDIPAPAVTPGLWTWRVTMLVEGKPFHMPKDGPDRMNIVAAPRRAADDGRYDEKNKRE
ncbi:MAG: hypothetical protein GC159_02415 [Phycisphaera sp.]|nr:hypothetical protein [Phycisphaera sp.]